MRNLLVSALVLALIWPFDRVADAAELVRLRVANQPVVAVATDRGIGGGLPTGTREPGVIVTLGDGTRHSLRFDDGRLTTSPYRSPQQSNLPPGGLPDGELTRGSHDISTAWLTDPTDRYGHGILGDAIEAGGIAARGEDGRIWQLALDAGSVFEDRRARLIDLDGDGRDEIIVVHSYATQGAALSVLGLQEDGLEFIAETPPIGRPGRWLNPVGAADFDGDGRIEIAYVETPHIGGILTLYEFSGGRVTLDGVDFGYSNHAIRSREQGLATLVDWNGDGVVDMAVPSADRSAIRIVSFAGGSFSELANVRLGDRIATGLVAADLDRDGLPDLIAGLGGDGSIAWIRP